MRSMYPTGDVSATIFRLFVDALTFICDILYMKTASGPMGIIQKTGPEYVLLWEGSIWQEGDEFMGPECYGEWKPVIHKNEFGRPYNRMHDCLGRRHISKCNLMADNK